MRNPRFRAYKLFFSYLINSENFRIFWGIINLHNARAKTFNSVYETVKYLVKFLAFQSLIVTKDNLGSFLDWHLESYCKQVLSK